MKKSRKEMSKYAQHQNQLNKTTLHLQKCFPNSRCFSRHVGKFYSTRVFHAVKNIYTIAELKNWIYSISKFMISINKPGMSDLYMIIPTKINNKVFPIHIELEIKTGKSKLSKDQIKWRSFCEKTGIKFIESRCEFETEKQIRKYIKDLLCTTKSSSILQ